MGSIREAAASAADDTSLSALPFGARFSRVRPLPAGSPVQSWLAYSGEERFVVKRLPAGSEPEAERARLLAETEALSKAHSAAVAWQEVAQGADASLYVLRPFVAGETLAERLSSRRLALGETLEIGRAVLQALAAIHALGVVHRNLKPSNVILHAGDQTTATLVDVGLSYDLSPSADGHARLARLARYVTPEQAGLVYQGIGESSDLYVFGLLLYEAITGAPAFEGDVFGEVLRRHLTAPVPSLRARGGTAPRALDDLLSRLLRKDPRDRYRTAAGVLGDLEALMQRLARRESDQGLVIGAYDRRERLTEPAFIGRARELAAVAATVEDARRGMGSLVCLEAESGGGKTRLLDELARRAEQRGVLVLRGRGHDLVASRPFHILEGVVEAIAERARADEHAAGLLRSRLTSLAENAAIALPVLAGVLLEGRAPEAGPEAFGETRTLQSVRRLFDVVGSDERPVLVVLDDCQWADELTVKMLTAWAAHPPSGGGRYASIVAAYRSEEVPAGHPLRLTPVRQVTLGPFTTDEVRGLVESMAGPVPEEASELVVRLAQGNPFMASAVLRGLVETGAMNPDANGWQIEPSAIADVRSSGHAVAMLHRRLELLPAPALRLLTAAAVLGREFDLGAAQDLSGQGSALALSSLAHARARHIVWPSVHRRRYVFTHDKLRETLLERLRDDERRRLHLEAAERMEEGEGDPPIYDLAYHFDSGGEPRRAFAYALDAAREARARNALEIAERYYRIAERGWEGAAPQTCYEVAVGLGEVLMLRGDYEAAAAALERAREWASNPFALAQLEGTTGELAFKRGDPRQGYLAIGRGLALLGRPVPTTQIGFALHAVREIAVQALHTLLPRVFLARLAAATPEVLTAVHLYNRLAYAFWFTQGTIPTLWSHLRGMNLAERCKPTAELAQAYSEHAPVITMIPWFERGRRYAARSLELRRELGDVWGQGQSLHFLGIVHYGAGRYREAIDSCQQASRVLDRTGDRWEAFTARWHTAISLYRLGEMAAAVQEVRRVYEGAVEIGDRQSRGIALGIWAKASEGDVPEELLRRELAEPSDDVHTSAELLMAQGVRLLRLGRAAEAADVLREARVRVREKGLRQEYVAAVLPWLATALRTQAEQVPPWAARERRTVRRRLRRAVRGARRIARWYRNNLPHALRETGYLAAMDGHMRRARRSLDASLAAARAAGARHEEGLTLEAIARVGEALGWPDAAEAGSRAQRVLAEAREGLREAATSPIGGHRLTLSLVDRFASVVESGRRIAAALSPDAIQGATAAALGALLRCEEAAVLLVDETDPSSSARLGAGKLEGAVCGLLIKRAVTEARAVVYDTDAPGELADSAELEDVASAVCAPVFSRGRIVACLYAVHRQVAGLFAGEEEGIVAFLATLAGAALENAEGFSRLQELNALLDARGKELESSNRELTQFAYVASHDLQEPLRNVSSYVQLLEDRAGPQLDDKARSYVRGALDGVERMRRLIDDLLAYSRVGMQQKPLEATDLGTVVDDVMHSLALTAADVHAEISRDELPSVLADRTQMEQLIQNLLSNALKFRKGTAPRVHVSAERDEREWTISIRDNGIGIDPKHAEQVFVVFKRLHTRSEYPGTGIGLAICAKIVERHGGRIWVESQLGAGATFRFTFPIVTRVMGPRAHGSERTRR